VGHMAAPDLGVGGRAHRDMWRCQTQGSGGRAYRGTWRLRTPSRAGSGVRAP